MPIARFQMPDGRIARFQVPDGYSPEQAQSEFEAFVSSSQKPQEEEQPAYKNLARLPKELLGFAEAPLALATGIGAAAIGGWKGIGNILAGNGLDAATKSVEETQGYQPITGVGQAIVGAVTAPIEKASEGLGMIGQSVAGDEGELVGKMLVPAIGAFAGYRPMVSGANAAATATRNAVSSLGEKSQAGAQKLMLNALKPTPKQYISGEAEIAAGELLKRDLSPNTKGVIALENRIAQLKQEIADSIKGSDAVISKQRVLDRLNAVRDRFIKTANPETDLAAVQAAGQGFASHPLIPGETLPVQLAQDIKQATYSELRKKYGELGTAQTEAQKALARGLKEEIAIKVPEVVPLNAEESALLKTLNVVERRAFMELNKDPVPITGALRGPGAWAAYTADKSAAFKSLLARMMYKTGQAMRKPDAVPLAPTSRIIPINKDIPYSGLPNIGNPPVIPGSWQEGMLKNVETGPGAMDIPVANPLLGMRSVEEGMLTLPETPLPTLPPLEKWSPKTGRVVSPFVKSGEIPKATTPASMEGAVPFELKLEVANRPEVIRATNAFIDEAAALKQAILSETNGFKRAQLEAKLRGTENRFMAGWKQLGFKNEAQLRDLTQKLYQGGEGTQLPIQHGFSGMMTP